MTDARKQGRGPGEEIILELQERIIQAKAESAESHKIAMNSYGAGYDCGFLEGLCTALTLFQGDQEDATG